MPDYLSLFATKAAQHGLDSHLLIAIANVESALKPYKVRFEPAWRYLYSPRIFAENLGITFETEVMLQSCSWGLCQVMGSVARELGFKDDMPRLCDPDIGLEYACRKIKALGLHYHGQEQDVIAAYNAGSARITPAGTYENERYVDRVNTLLRRLRSRDNSVVS